MKKKIFGLIVIVVTLIVATACSTPERSDSGFCIEPGIQCDVTAPTGNLSYIILNDEDVDTSFYNDAQKAEEIVRKWWGDDETFVSPTWLPVEIWSSESDIYGFSADGYVFASYNCGKLQRMLTMVHECIHTQCPEGLLWREGEEKCYGLTLMEMVVEKTAVDLLGGVTEDVANQNYCFFITCPKLMEVYPQLEQGFKNKTPAKEVYQDIFGMDAKEILNKIDQYNSLDISGEEDEEFLELLGTSVKELKKALYNR